METIRRMLEHQQWADRRLLDSLRRSGGGSSEARRLLRHILIAEQVWALRLEGRGTSHLRLWAEEDDLDALARLLEDNAQRYAAILPGLTEARLDEQLEYRNQSGVPFRTPIRDILAHVALHGQYHRGQVNRLVREAGDEPQALDYIVYARESGS